MQSVYRISIVVSAGLWIVATINHFVGLPKSTDILAAAAVAALIAIAVRPNIGE